MAPSGCMVFSVPEIMAMPRKAAVDHLVPYFSLRPAYLDVRNWCSSSQEPQQVSLCVAGAHFKTHSFTSSHVQKEDHHNCFLPRRRKFRVPRASNKYSPSRLNYYPPMTEKPKWWWRTLACIPYLIPLHATWKCAEYAFHLNPFLEELEFFADSFHFYINSYPPWFWMVYPMALYFGVVRRRQWPHFLRFHFMNSVLLEHLLDITMIVCGWMPRLIFRGRAGLHFWTAVAVAYLFTVLECMRSSLAGMYADVPFVSDATYMHCSFF